VPAGKMVHAVVDNYATHKQPKVRAWLVHPQTAHGDWQPRVKDRFIVMQSVGDDIIVRKR